MQHRYFAKACARVVTGMFVGVLMSAAAGAFADEANTLSQSSATAIRAESTSFSSVSPSDTSSATAPTTSGGRAKAFFSGMAGKAGDVVVGALNMIGVRYRWGGDSPDSGLDCSGFVRYVFQDTLGLALPRRAEEMSRVGEKVRVSELKPGDLVFFNTMRRTFSHVGIYIGDNKFVHSPSTGSTIRVDDMDDRYWEKRFTGARRIESHVPLKPEELRQRVSATMDATAGN
ncbi:C40 family peptidase [Trinickia caryophylli]|uniref:Cell wall-associated hydrolase, NlpC family n=1 Tax=Trinickia caryophylli TaxID=28094 RepID=A0A1X7DIB1_TRICW|nr:C40 family peptidase [Trinickia caryophylli]PMS12302.1 peptidoglycan endopeptidase [Trinickia caryophylli]TRX17026.1 NlpC/P60 family protein [Trinickia caryophylli]WQE12235.1 C40 family peptidase [Trinickia caryophylli]SMF15862.1 Cell wall-associated hydrolase, NlpC family [Trinickia caryophylli]GLU31624.1 peptidase P60 [Trinickia caryophylli]